MSKLLFFLLIIANSAIAQPKPNILWITIEDTSPQFIGCYGNENVRTPVIDKLAAEGIRFTNAFSTGTVCSPSRTAIITGVKTYKTGTGNHRSKYPVPEFIKGFPYYLQQLGYYTTNNAKTDYNVAGEKEFIAEAWNESSNNAGWWDRKPGQPFFAVFNYNESHQSRTMTETYGWYVENIYNQLLPNERTGDNHFEMPPFYLDSPEMYKHLSPWGKAGIVSDELIDFTDLAPTIISLAGGEIPGHLEGRPVLGKNRKKQVKQLFLSSDRSDNGIDMVRSVTDGRFVYSRNFMPFINEARYIRYMEIGQIKQQMRKDLAENKLNPLQKSLFEPRPVEFLFDIKNDLWETNNLAENSDYKPVLEKMHELMKEEILKSRDVMFLPEYEIALLSETTSVYEFRLNKTKYPLEKIYEAASQAGFRGKEVAAKQIEMLKSPDNIVRYWAIMGLRSQNKEDLLSFSEDILISMEDKYPPIAATASAIAYEMFNNKTASENLKKFCVHENLQISLMAINYLLYTKNREPFVETIREVQKMKDRDYNVRAACMDVLGSLGLVPNNPDFKE